MRLEPASKLVSSADPFLLLRVPAPTSMKWAEQKPLLRPRRGQGTWGSAGLGRGPGTDVANIN